MRYVLGVVLLSIFALGLGVLIPRPFLASTPGPVAAAAGSPSPESTRTVLLLSTEIHTDLALPASPDVVARFSFMAADGLDPSQPGVSYIIAGWGGRSFYIETPRWADLKPGPVFNALTYDRSVMHMALGGGIDQNHPTVTEIELDEASFERVLQGVLASFTLDSAGERIVVPGAQYGEYDLFYEAEGLFNALAGCNVWTAATLRQAGLRTGWWTPLPGLLSLSLKLHNPRLGL
ncbi:MAG: TIGR02117 family protein [Hoeflea sp.]|uniref:TIGR02117 family protein n=1 Tax=Hoeflea sp. TaxID=1940281 RepID=UPI001D75963A|nr:TIGR02117 family protein [Hoeflea sp.]MBU4530667.1 TIGR02117 family protein [Alphaproteobacteria bacterium]MBU4544887.1 TIGR02117 family protein [Alphaproteobacteria bacterium]MBU4552030.1 TIGR02117 family protein [Alphaproteobacteria bacterium]MBV1722219.1 TIGR02117 family protein [Hoeflea sp.]MBV1761781.1 TIGR02117 family protein [Hoeflea sp.]